jgi:hypothetical protein
MPQPLTKFDVTGGFKLSPAVIGEEPALALHVAEVVTTWAFVEAALGASLAKILGTSAEVGIAMHSAIVSGPAKSAAIQAVADLLLTGEELEIFQSLLRLTTAAAKERHPIAHGLWARSPTIPDALLLVEPAEWVSMYASLAVWKGHLAAPIRGMKPEAICVYRERDFTSITKRSCRLLSYFVRFWALLDGPESERGERRQALLNEPDIRRELVHLQQAREKNQTPQKQSPPAAPPPTR